MGSDADRISSNGGLDQDVCADALTVLRDALLWQMAPEPWEAVRAAVRDLAAAVDRRDADGARAATAELAMLGPVRASPLGSTPTVPASEPVRDEINELVRTLDGRTPSST